MKHIELSDLNHRMLIEKMREDLRALEKNMDILYFTIKIKTEFTELMEYFYLSSN